MATQDNRRDDSVDAVRARSEGNGSSESQALQRELVERAMKIPGVAEALEAYAAVERYVPAVLRQPQTKIRYATGGNA